METTITPDGLPDYEREKRKNVIICAIDNNISELSYYLNLKNEIGIPLGSPNLNLIKTKDYATLSKDEVIKGLRSLTLGAHDARVDLKNLIDDAKNKLGIK